jgi:hypothetical protein
LKQTRSPSTRKKLAPRKRPKPAAKVAATAAPSRPTAANSTRNAAKYASRDAPQTSSISTFFSATSRAKADTASCPRSMAPAGQSTSSIQPVESNQPSPKAA